MKTLVREAKSPRHPVVPAGEWLAARRKLLARERELTHLRDAVARERRALPWVRIEKDYVFEGPDGPVKLAGLFAGRRQLLVQHFMFGPGWEEGCPSCSLMADHADGITVHLADRGVAFAAISRGAIRDIERFKRRMGWRFPWVSSAGNDFNFDFGVSFTKAEEKRGEVTYNYAKAPFECEELPGLSAFIRDESGQVFHTYSTYRRGVEAMIGTYDLLDLMPLGRNEEGLSYPMEWVRHHDKYEAAPVAHDACCGAHK